MIKINTNESKKLKFKVSVSGVQAQDLRGSMKIIMDGIEYGFPIRIDNGSVVVNVSPLTEVTGRQFKDGDTFDSRLELIANETYLVPWTDKIKVENPVKVEATIESMEEEVTEEKKPKISVSDISEEEDTEKDDSKMKNFLNDEKNINKDEDVEVKIPSRFRKLFEGE